MYDRSNVRPKTFATYILLSARRWHDTRLLAEGALIDPLAGAAKEAKLSLLLLQGWRRQKKVPVKSEKLRSFRSSVDCKGPTVLSELSLPALCCRRRRSTRLWCHAELVESVTFLVEPTRRAGQPFSAWYCTPLLRLRCIECHPSFRSSANTF